MEAKEATYVIRAGVVVHLNGIPLEVLADTPVFTNPANIPLLAQSGAAAPDTASGESGKQ